MTIRTLKVKAGDVAGMILRVFPITSIRPKHIIHPIKSIKRSYEYSEYGYGNEGGWDCVGTPGETCPDRCDGCEHHVYHKPFKPWVGGFLYAWLKFGFKAIAAAFVCAIKGHKLNDCSSAGPDSGNMDHECLRCGRYWHVPLY